MTFIKDAFQAAIEQGKLLEKSERTREVVKIPGEHPHVFRTRDQDNKLSEPQYIQQPPKEMMAFSLADVISQVKAGLFEATPTIVVDQDQIVIFHNIDNITAEDVSRFTILKSDLLDAMKDWNSVTGMAFDQATLRKNLIGPWHGCLPPGSPLINQVSNINWASVGDDKAHIEHGGASYGKAINQKATAGDGNPHGLPEEIQVFNVRASALLDVTTIQPVRVMLTIDVQRQAFVLTPSKQDVLELRHKLVTEIVANLQRAFPESKPETEEMAAAVINPTIVRGRVK